MSKEFKRELLIQVVMTVVLLAGVATILFYLGSRISTASQRIYRTRTENALLNSEVAQISNLRGQEQEAKQYESQLSSTLPSKSNVLVLSNTIDAIGTRDGVNVAFQFGAEGQKSANNLNYVEFEISVQGSYANITKFVQDVENSSYYLAIDNMSLVEGTGGLSGVINGKAYFYDNGTGQSQ